MKTILVLLFIFTIVGIAHSVPMAAQSPEKQQPIPISKAGEFPSMKTDLGSITGTVLETIDAAGYTYIRLKTPKEEIWAAVQKATVKKGSKVTIVNATLMEGFESNTLKRKFDRIFFGNLSTGSSGTMNPSPFAPGHGTQKQGSIKAQHSGVANGSQDIGEIKVKKAEGSDGKTVAEIYANKAKLKDTTVSVRGKVVKYNPKIMGKNWVHLRDGTGSPEKKDNDITVTTLDTVVVGDEVLVRGKVHLDRDFGSGYSYPVIIEDGKVVK